MNDGSSNTITKTVQGAGYGVAVGISLTNADLQSLGAFNGKRVTINSINAVDSAGNQIGTIDYGSMNLTDTAGINLNLKFKSTATVNGVTSDYYLNDQTSDNWIGNIDRKAVNDYRNLFSNGSNLGGGLNTATTTNVKNGIDNKSSAIVDNFTLVLPGLADFRDNKLGGAYASYDTQTSYITNYDQGTTAIAMNLANSSETYIHPEYDRANLIVRNAGLSFAVNVSKPVAQINLVETATSIASSLSYNHDTGSFYFSSGSYGTNWNNATLSAANGYVAYGVPGHLVHSNNAVENAYIASIYDGNPGWLGGSDKNNEDIWQWYYGATAGETFSKPFDPTTLENAPNKKYDNWGNNEPGGGADEVYLQMNHPSLSSGAWLDNLPLNSGLTNRYIVEYEGSGVLNRLAYGNGNSIKVTSTEAGTAYLVKSGTTPNTVSDITNQPDNRWNSTSITSSGTNKVLSFEDFRSAPTDWSSNTHTVLGGTMNGFLGRFTEDLGDSVTHKTYNFGTNLANQTVKIEFDMYEIDSWDGEKFNVLINDNLTSSVNYHNSQSSIIDGGINVGDLSNSSNGGLNGFDEEVHHYSLQATLDSLGKVKIGFGSVLDQSVSDESWGIDNLQITTVNSGTSLSLAGLTVGNYHLYTTNASGILSLASLQTIAVI